MWFCRRVSTTENPLTTAAEAHDEPETGPALPGILIDPAWLGDHLDDQRVRVVDLRDREEYADGHISGAVQLDLQDLGSSRDGCDNVLLSSAEFEFLMARLGVCNRDTVVAYDDYWGLPSARLVWALHHFGHRSAAVLNGGWSRWQENGRPMIDGLASHVPAPVDMDRFVVHPSPEVDADYEWITGALSRGDVILLDTRSNAEFDQGHLPGAVSWDWFNAVPPESWECSRDSEVLRSELAALGVRQSDEVVAYCRSGMRATHTYVVLRHAGFRRVRMYDGSWQEWRMKGAPDRQDEDDR